MDDRAALAIATAAGEKLAGRDELPYRSLAGSTVQEENGLLGAASLVDEMSFDYAIALDVGLTGDIPGPDKRDFPSRLGAGPIVVYQDARCHYSRRLSDRLIDVAKAKRDSDPARGLSELRKRRRGVDAAGRRDRAADLSNPVHPFAHRDGRRGRFGSYGRSSRCICAGRRPASGDIMTRKDGIGHGCAVR